MLKIEKPIKCLTGSELHCKNWQIEGILRMLFNVVDPEVAKDPERLIVYGGTGKVARNWKCFERIVKTLTELELDETMLVQSGKPVAVFKTHEWAPRALLVNSMLVCVRARFKDCLRGFVGWVSARERFSVS